MLMILIFSRLGRLATVKGEYQTAQHFYQKGIEIAQQFESPPVMEEHLIPLAALAIYQKDYESAERYLMESVTHAESLNSMAGKFHATYYLAELARHRTEFDEAAWLLIESIEMTLADPKWRDNFTN